METQKFKTNIKCGGCVATVTPFLDKLSDVQHWQVDTESADKILTVEGVTGLDSQHIIDTIKKAGYQAEKL